MDFLHHLHYKCIIKGSSHGQYEQEEWLRQTKGRSNAHMGLLKKNVNHQKWDYKPLWTTVPVSVHQIPESLLTRQLTAFTDLILQPLQIEAPGVT